MLWCVHRVTGGWRSVGMREVQECVPGVCFKGFLNVWSFYPVGLFLLLLFSIFAPLCGTSLDFAVLF